MIRVIVIGAPGRMGQRVIAQLRTDPELQLVGALAHASHPDLGRDAGEVAGGGALGVAVVHELEALLTQTDVIIDVSVADATLSYMPKIAAAGKAMVIGRTGFTDSQQDEIERLSADMRCFLAPKMSLGVNVLFQVVRQVAAALGADYDVEIMEAHHRTKVDAPSGTAHGS